MREKLIIDGEECVKNGHTATGKQKYRRKSDKKIITEGSKVRCSDEIKYLAVLLYFKSMSMNNIGETFGVTCTTVMNWLDEFCSEVKTKFSLTNVNSINDLEIDEIFHYLDNKKKEFTFLRQLIENHTKLLITR